MCQTPQTSPASIFVITAIAQRHMGDENRLLRGRAFRRLTPGGHSDTLIDTADDFVALLRLPEAATIWDRICARHAELFEPRPAQPAPNAHRRSVIPSTRARQAGAATGVRCPCP